MLVLQFSSQTPFRIHAAFTYVNALRKHGFSAQVISRLIATKLHMKHWKETLQRVRLVRSTS
jgi:hypothetical protein